VIFDQDHGFTDIMTAPYTFANSRVRQMYGLPAAGTANASVGLAIVGLDGTTARHDVGIDERREGEGDAVGLGSGG